VCTQHTPICKSENATDGCVKGSKHARAHARTGVTRTYMHTTTPLMLQVMMLQTTVQKAQAELAQAQEAAVAQGEAGEW